MYLIYGLSFLLTSYLCTIKHLNITFEQFKVLFLFHFYTKIAWLQGICNRWLIKAISSVTVSYFLTHAFLSSCWNIKCYQCWNWWYCLLAQQGDPDMVASKADRPSSNSIDKAKPARGYRLLNWHRQVKDYASSQVIHNECFVRWKLNLNYVENYSVMKFEALTWYHVKMQCLCSILSNKV